MLHHWPRNRVRPVHTHHVLIAAMIGVMYMYVCLAAGLGLYSLCCQEKHPTLESANAQIQAALPLRRGKRPQPACPDAGRAVREFGDVVFGDVVLDDDMFCLQC